MNIIIQNSLSNPNWEMFSKIDPYLSELFFVCCNFLRSQKIDEIIITSIIRPHIPDKDSGVHECGRAIDFSDKTIPREIGEKLQTFINSVYPYDVSRPEMETLKYHTGSGYNGEIALHYHLQVNAG